MGTPWRTRRAWGAVIAALALMAGLVAGVARRVVFDVDADPAAASAPAVDIHPGSPWTRLPARIPGPAAGRPASITFHLHPAPVAPLVLSLDLLPSAAPAGDRLMVAVNDAPLSGVSGRPSGMPAGRDRYRIRLPAGAFGDGPSGRLSLVAGTGAPVTLHRVRLVEARPSFALRHLGRRGRFPVESGVFLAASLVGLVAWRPPGEPAGRRAARAGGAAVVLALLVTAFPAPRFVGADVPRWLWLATPWVLLLLGRRPRNPERAAGQARTWLVNALVATTALAVAVAGAELVVRFVHRRVQSAADARSHFARRQAEQNSLGFRERDFTPTPPPETYRIAVVGDSLAWGIGVSPAERFSGQLERALNAGRRGGPRYEVLNFSHAGWDTADELDALRTVVLETRPRFVVLQWYVNDFENGVRDGRPRPAPLVPWETLRLRLFHASALYSALEEKWVRLQEWLGVLETYPEYMYRRFGDPRSPYSAATVATLRAFIAECRARGIPVTVLLFPHAGPDLARGRYEYDYLHDRVLETCRREEIACVDLRASFAAYADYRDLWVSPLDPHPSALAHRLAAQRLLDTFAR